MLGTYPSEYRRYHVGMRIVLGADDKTELTDAILKGLHGRGFEIEVVGPPAGEDKDWVAVEVILEEKQERELIPRLKRAGATGIITYPLNKVIP